MEAPLPASNGTVPIHDATRQTVPDMAQTQGMSAAEIALYDRQIRLWGVQAQEKIRTANILIVSIKALANEVAKNLVLAGIGSLTLVDSETVTEDDLCSQFFISEADVGKNRAEAVAPQIRKLNPRVDVRVITQDIRIQGPEFYNPFDIVIATDLDFNTLTMISAATRLSNTKFYAAGAHGFYGYIFADLISHDYNLQRDKSNMPTLLKPESATRSIIAVSTKKESGKVIEMITKRELYTPLLLANSSPLPPEFLRNRRRMKQVSPLLTCLRALWEYQKMSGATLPSRQHADLQLFTTLATEKHKEFQLPADTLKSAFLRSFLQNLGSELAPVTAFLGGQLAQDVINVLGMREQPIQNLLLFDGEESKAPVYALHPIFDDPIAPIVAVPTNSVTVDLD